jgi:hypothetical protein
LAADVAKECAATAEPDNAFLVAATTAGYFQDNIVTHLVAGLGAGFFAVCVGSPVDVVKSRVMGRQCPFALDVATLVLCCQDSPTGIHSNTTRVARKGIMQQHSSSR